MEKIKKYSSKIAYYSFYIALVIEVLMVIIDKSAYTNPIEGRLFQITFLLFLIKVCLTRYMPREYLIIFFFCILGTVSYFATGRNEVIRLVMFAAACKDIDIKKCLKLVFYMTLIGCGLLVLLSLTGVYGDVALTQEYGRGGVETRYTLGMGHPNALQCMVWALTVLALYLYGEGMKWYHYGVVLIVNFFFFLLTDSKTSLLVTIFTLMITIIMSLKKCEWLKKISTWICFGVTLLSIVMSVLIAGSAYRLQLYACGWDNTPITMFLVKLNDVLNGRIRVLSGTTNFEGTIQTWSLFSRPENNYYFDMGWVRLFYWYGIIPASTFIVVMLLVMWYCYKKKHYMAIMMITSFALYTVIEAHGISVYMARNYVFFLIGAYWWKTLDLLFRKKRGLYENNYDYNSNV